MNRDKISLKAEPSGVRRTTSKPLTAVAVANLKTGAVLADGGIQPGAGRLKVRKRKTGGAPAVEWLFEYRRDGASVRITLGRYGADGAAGMNIEQARAVARDLQAQVREGQDPAAKRELDRQQTRNAQRAAVAAAREVQHKTLRALLAAYVDSLRSKGKTSSAYDAQNLFANHVAAPFPELVELPAAEVKPEHVTRVLARLVGPDALQKKGRTALKLRSYMAAAFSLAIGAGTNPMAPAGAAGFGLAFNPASSVSPREMAAHFNRKGERALTSDELARYIARVDTLPSVLTRIALRLQLVTGGQRIRQLLRLRASDVTVNAIVLYDPKGKRQQPRRHEIPMVPEVVELIDELMALWRGGDPGDSGLLFAADGVPMAAETLSIAVRDISTAMVASGEATSPFRGGDIRRTVETMMGSGLRISKDDRAQLLSHGLGGVQDANYDKGDYRAAKAEALRKWNDYIADLCIGASDTAKVIRLHQRTA